jgi:hypothetical protein
MAWWIRTKNARHLQTFRRFIKQSCYRENGYNDRGQAWRGRYEVDDLGTIVEKLWNDMRPLYLELHASVRYKLTKFYSGKVFEDDYIEAHLLGNMWAQNLVNIFDLLEPYKNKLVWTLHQIWRMISGIIPSEADQIGREFFPFTWIDTPSCFLLRKIFVTETQRSRGSMPCFCMGFQVVQRCDFIIRKSPTMQIFVLYFSIEIFYHNVLYL